MRGKHGEPFLYVFFGLFGRNVITTFEGGECLVQLLNASLISTMILWCLEFIDTGPLSLFDFVDWSGTPLLHFYVTMVHGYYLPILECFFNGHMMKLNHLQVSYKLSHFAIAYTEMSVTHFPLYKKKCNLVELIIWEPWSGIHWYGVLVKIICKWEFMYFPPLKERF